MHPESKLIADYTEKQKSIAKQWNLAKTTVAVCAVWLYEKQVLLVTFKKI